ncbi:DUF1330 domain-containing protein [Streptomyces caatingaensis]|uniref:DUF1330 domain-containing protein n=1 Tax=Streptomyces caatingaensis TaxID=1678637 RepID=A0A0K9XBH1_9ACTN|nr:DUF1330 domain-containing protein [Streptomyces caatingaensis]KNB50745.1 hypothetical protein AC230_19965 [Streptomyces caatingaensis]
MSAYVISEVDVLDEELADTYRALAEASIRRYDGRYIVRGAVPEAVEGTWPSSQRVVIVEFPDAERAKEWYASAEYAEALEIRKAAMERRLLLVEGVSG